MCSPCVAGSRVQLRDTRPRHHHAHHRHQAMHDHCTTFIHAPRLVLWWTTTLPQAVGGPAVRSTAAPTAHLQATMVPDAARHGDAHRAPGMAVGAVYRRVPQALTRAGLLGWRSCESIPRPSPHGPTSCPQGTVMYSFPVPHHNEWRPVVRMRIRCLGRRHEGWLPCHVATGPLCLLQWLQIPPR